ncbi:hypothetical protein IB277_19335 [Ensifer sp. ENS07]|uniref:phosphorylase family protein n=1 Tax=Ensifer sp. ENS07 TaxID=2769274 RepID=UPI00177A81CA|nr:hypothetical protein [Ensifer sp. ENS07]MBD9638460.1 hypothetical protein [Ensifer sp. ENS07]
MKVLVIEDQDPKFDAVREQVIECFESLTLVVERAETMQQATKSLYQSKYDLIVVDLMLPLRNKAEDPIDISDDIVGVIESSDKNRGSNIVALTGFNDLFDEKRQVFNDAGILIVRYGDAKEEWRRSLAAALGRIKEQESFDFVVLCALEKERGGFRQTSAVLGPMKNVRGIDCLVARIGDLRGAIVRLPRMGLVEASISAARVIEQFKPRLVAMSGICAGVVGNAEIGTIVVADICWEYQAGKWADDDFRMEHYDVPLDDIVKTTINQFIEQDPKGRRIKEGLIDDAIIFKKMSVGPMATGSAVIADEKKILAIHGQHRKMAALDMEMYGIYRAAFSSAHAPIYFGAKTVVDLADGNKNDKYHDYGCAASARLVVELIPLLLGAEKPTGH